MICSASCCRTDTSLFLSIWMSISEPLPNVSCDEFYRSLKCDGFETVTSTVVPKFRLVVSFCTEDDTKTVNQQTQLEAQLKRWTNAALIDQATAERILSSEAASAHKTTMRWPVLLALFVGGLMVAAGVTLFVAAHWDEISQPARFALVLLMVAVFHGAGALFSERHPSLSTTLHALGTVALGASIFL